MISAGGTNATDKQTDHNTEKYVGLSRNTYAPRAILSNNTQLAYMLIRLLAILFSTFLNAA